MLKVGTRIHLRWFSVYLFQRRAALSHEASLTRAQVVVKVKDKNQARSFFLLFFLTSSFAAAAAAASPSFRAIFVSKKAREKGRNIISVTILVAI